MTLQPKGTEVSAELAFDFCQDEGIVGVGWPLSEEPESKQHAKAQARERWDRLPGPVNAVVSKMGEGDHAWVYGESTFWVCRIESDWLYEAGSQPWDRCDIHHYREASWKRVPAPLVPGVVKRNLFQRGAAHEISTGVGEATRALSGWLYATEDLEEVLEEPVPYGEVVAGLEGLDTHQILQLLSPEEVEDVVGVWVQDRGWRMLKSSTYQKKRTWECEFTRAGAEGPETAYMQVKSGNTSLRAGPYLPELQSGEWLYLFSTARNPYPDRDQVEKSRVVFLEADEVVEFLAERLGQMPAPIALKLGLATGVVQ